jgi:uncharacterized protein
MTEYTLSKRFSREGPVSERGIRVCRMFGLTVDRLDERVATCECRLDIRPGDIVYITGPSGSGKSVLLHELQGRIDPGRSIDLAAIPLPNDRSVIDCFGGSVEETLRALSLVAMSEVSCVLNAPRLLSDGQRFRFRLAQALVSGKPFIFADEFGSALDPVTAAAVAFNVHRFIKRSRTAFVAAGSRTDILADLSPDVLVVKPLCGPAQVTYKDRR